MTTILALLIVYQFKHWFADYPLQREWMLGKFLDRGWVAPLAAHAAVHAVMTLGIAWAASGSPALALKLAALDFAAHFAMDRVKASRKLLGRYKPLTPYEYSLSHQMINRAYHDPLLTPDQRIAYVEFGKSRLRSNQLFWWSLGIDQMVHHLTHYAIIYFLVRG